MPSRRARVERHDTQLGGAVTSGRRVMFPW